MDRARWVVEYTFRQEADRILASLISAVRDFELAQDALQDAFLIALECWPVNGIPPNPGAWITTTAHRKAIDRLRRDSTLARKQLLLQELLTLEGRREAEMDNQSIPDERLKLILTCCHPALALEARIALTLHTLGGLSTAEIASTFFVPVATMAQRLTRAKRKIKNAAIPYRVPPIEILGERVDAVLFVLYLIFNEGYSGTSGNTLIRGELCDEAMRLARVLTTLLEQQSLYDVLAEALGLLALMLLHDSRRNARVGPDGHLILLEDQDRSLWDQDKKQEGLALLDKALNMRHIGHYQIQAAISALHVQARSPNDTDWPQIAALYSILMRMTPSPVVELNRIVAVAMADGPLTGLALLEHSELHTRLHDYYLFYATLADLLRRAGKLKEAQVAYTHALDLCQNEIECTFFKRRIIEVSMEST